MKSMQGAFIPCHCGLEFQHVPFESKPSFSQLKKLSSHHAVHFCYLISILFELLILGKGLATLVRKRFLSYPEVILNGVMDRYAV